MKPSSNRALLAIGFAIIVAIAVGVVATVFAVFVFNPSGPNAEFSCGTRANRSFETADDGIVRDAAAWPWTVSVVSDEGRDAKARCTGSIISPRHILTAARCGTTSATRIYAGSVDAQGQQGKPLLVKNIHVPHGYDSAKDVNDIAIIELTKDLEFGETVRPVCLPLRFNYRESHQAKAYFAGFGVPLGERPDMPMREKLLKLRYKLSHTPARSAVLLCSLGYDRSTVLLASADANKSPVTRGSYTSVLPKQATLFEADSGGPLVVQRGDWFQAGVASVNLLGLGIFTRMDRHCEWIAFFTDSAAGCRPML